MPPRTAVTKKGGKRRYVREVVYEGGKVEAVEYINVTGCTKYWGDGPWKIPYGSKTTAECYGQDPKKIQALYDADPEAAIKYLKGAPYRDRDEAAARGTKVHEAWEQHLKGEEPEFDDEMVEKMFRHIKVLCERYEVIWERSEQTVFSDDGWAGTMDGIILIKFPGEEKHRRCVVDLKSSRSVAGKHEYVMQLAALRHGTVIVHDDGSEEPMPETDGAVIFHVRPDEASVIPVVADQAAYRDFMVCVAMAYAEQASEARVTFLPPLADPNDDTKLLTNRGDSESEKR